jgi:hypothetical protein
VRCARATCSANGGADGDALTEKAAAPLLPGRRRFANPDIYEFLQAELQIYDRAAAA